MKYLLHIYLLLELYHQSEYLAFLNQKIFLSLCQISKSYLIQTHHLLKISLRNQLGFSYFRLHFYYHWNNIRSTYAFSSRNINFVSLFLLSVFSPPSNSFFLKFNEFMKASPTRSRFILLLGSRANPLLNQLNCSTFANW